MNCCNDYGRCTGDQDCPARAGELVEIQPDPMDQLDDTADREALYLVGAIYVVAAILMALIMVLAIHDLFFGGAL